MTIPKYQPSNFRGQVPPEEFERFTRWLAENFGGTEATQEQPLEPRDRGDGYFGDEPPEPDAKQRAAGDVE